MTQTTDLQDIKQIKQRVNDALWTESFNNLGVRKRFFKNKFGERCFDGWAIVGTWVEWDDDLCCQNKYFTWERDSIWYAYETREQRRKIVAKLREHGLNAEFCRRGDHYELIIADPCFDWNHHDKSFSSFKFNFFKITKSL